MKNNILKTMVGTVERKMIKTEMNMRSMARKVFAKKEGASSWTDVALLVLIGLVLAIIFKDKISALINTIFGKIDGSITLW